MTTADAPAPKAQLTAAADRLRDAAKWMLASFGATAAVVFAGINLSGIGDVSGTRLAISSIAAGVAVMATVAALSKAMALNAASTVTTETLARKAEWHQLSLKHAQGAVAEDPHLAPWNGIFADFVVELKVANEAMQAQLDAYVEDEALEASAEWFNRAVFRAEHLQGLMQTILESASYLRLQHSFKLARWAIVASLAVAAAGVITFAAVAHPDATDIDLPAAPSFAVFDVPDDSKEDVADRLGRECPYDLDDLPVTVMSLEDGEGEAVSVPTSSCAPARLDVTDARLNVSR